MTSTGNPHENAQMESFIATLKREEVFLSEYNDIEEALLRIGYFIEDVYNKNVFTHLLDICHQQSLRVIL